MEVIGDNLAIRHTRAQIPSAHKLNQNQKSNSLRPTKIPSKKQTKIISNQNMITQISNPKYKSGYRHTSPCKSNPPLRASKLSYKSKGQRTDDKTIRKAPNRKQKDMMLNSLNITHHTPYIEQFTRSNSQQLTTSHLNNENSFNFASSLMQTFVKTSKVLEEYQKTCNLLKRQNKQIKRQFAAAKNQIIQLKKHSSLKRSKEL